MVAVARAELTLLVPTVGKYSSFLSGLGLQRALIVLLAPQTSDNSALISTLILLYFRPITALNLTGSKSGQIIGHDRI